MRFGVVRNDSQFSVETSGHYIELTVEAELGKTTICFDALMARKIIAELERGVEKTEQWMGELEAMFGSPRVED